MKPDVIASSSSAPSVPPGAEDGKRPPSFQELGTVKLPEGRIVTYPNTLQHKFEAPKLEQLLKPGYMQLMQIHLVDPHYVVCSTRFVPPQSLDWWKEAINYQAICLRNGVPNEISQKIIECLLVPERWLDRNKKRVRGLQNYWQTKSVSVDDRQPCQPPIGYESALRIKQYALQGHERVMRAVNAPKLYEQPRAFTIWRRSIFNGWRPGDDDDPQVAASTGEDAADDRHSR